MKKSEKILISWVGKKNDFLLDGKGSPDPNGPTCQLHKYFYDYCYHVILSSAYGSSSDLPFEALVDYLKENYNHDVRKAYMDVGDVIDLNEIKAKVDKLLIENRDKEIEVFISTGTPTMQVSWYLAHLELGLKTKLFQIRPARFTKSKLPEKVYVNVERSSVTSSLIIKEDLRKNQKQNILITDSIKPVYSLAEKAAAADNVTVLISGATGTGKEGLATFIHENSPRNKRPFVAVNCAAMGDSLLESRLFGYAKGAHNTAFSDKKGLFEDADGGTIFLDEIGDISPFMQQSLLRVLQAKEITRIGESKTRKIDVRVICATNKDLKTLCKEGKFRYDLFYRLAVLELYLPPLNQRGVKDLEQIFNFIVKGKQKDFNKPLPVISQVFKDRLFKYSFPGNIRELENLVEKLYVSSEMITDGFLEEMFFDPEDENRMTLKSVENLHILKVVNSCNGNISAASKILGISYNTLKSKIS